MKSEVHDSPVLKPLEPIPIFARRKWFVFKDWRKKLPDGTVALIPRGLIIDGASVPWPLTILSRPTGSLFIPSLVHDYGYRHDSLMIQTDTYVEIAYRGNGRAFWDDLMLEMSNHSAQRPRWYNRAVWVALRVFGWVAWRKYRKA